MQILRILVIFQSFVNFSLSLAVDHENSKDPEDSHEIAKRSIFHPWLLYSLNAATGILCAIAVPLEHLDRTVTVSYNFEANYNMPNIPSDSVPGVPWVRWKLGSTYENTSVNPSGDANPDDAIARGMSDEKSNSIVADETEKLEMRKRSALDIDKMILTRKGVYRLLESRITANGFDGKKCLLRAICESAKSSLLEANGILGHVLHIMLTPSTSQDENLPTEYAKAENLGYLNNCEKYTSRCGVSVLNLISHFV